MFLQITNLFLEFSNIKTSKTINLGIPLAKILSAFYPAYRDQFMDIKDTISVFTRRKKTNNTMDFDDLILDAYIEFVQGY